MANETETIPAPVLQLLPVTRNETTLTWESERYSKKAGEKAGQEFYTIKWPDSDKATPEEQKAFFDTVVKWIGFDKVCTWIGGKLRALGQMAVTEALEDPNGSGVWDEATQAAAKAILEGMVATEESIGDLQEKQESIWREIPEVIYPAMAKAQLEGNSTEVGRLMALALKKGEEAKALDLQIAQKRRPKKGEKKAVNGTSSTPVGAGERQVTLQA